MALRHGQTFHVKTTYVTSCTADFPFTCLMVSFQWFIISVN